MYGARGCRTLLTIRVLRRSDDRDWWPYGVTTSGLPVGIRMPMDKVRPGRVAIHVRPWIREMVERGRKSLARTKMPVRGATQSAMETELRRLDDLLDEALKETFPASDSVALTPERHPRSWKPAEASVHESD